MAGESKNSNAKGKQKGKDKKNPESNPKEKPNPLDGVSGSKKDKQKKGEKNKCPYCKRGYHLESSCRKKTIDQMAKLLEQNHISLPEGTRKADIGTIQMTVRDAMH